MSNGSHKSCEKMSWYLYFGFLWETIVDTHQGKDKDKCNANSCCAHPAFSAGFCSRWINGCCGCALLLYLLTTVCISPVHVCFKYLFHTLTFLALLRMGKYPAIPLCCICPCFRRVFWRLCMCLSSGLCVGACVCVWSASEPSLWTLNLRNGLTFCEARLFALLPRVRWHDRCHSHVCEGRKETSKNGKKLKSI